MHDDHDADHQLEWLGIVRIGFVAVACAAVWFRLWEPFEKVSLIGLTAALIGMFPILKEALEAVFGTAHDHGAFHDDRDRSRAGDRTVFYRTCHYSVCVDCRSSRGHDCRPWKIGRAS